MSGGRIARLVIFAAILLGIATLFSLRRSDEGKSGPVVGSSRPASQAAAGVAAAERKAGDGQAEVPAEPPSRIADNLNAPEGTIRRDLEILNEVFEAWQTNFPRTGNPVGENSEITAALTGDNTLKFVFIPRSHRAINAGGELCDRWGTPFRLHQLSGTQMEFRSAGPDRKFGTIDDAQWPATP